MSSLVEWLAETKWSIALHESVYAYMVIESIHVICITLFVGMVAMLDLRLLGLAFKQVPVSQLTSRILPPAIVGFALMVATGLLLFYAIPVRTYHSVWFRAKMAFLAIAGINVYLFHRRVQQTQSAWDNDEVPPSRVRRTGGLSLAIWACVIVFGRLIAYNWFDCGRDIPGWVDWISQCPPDDADAGEQ